MVRLFAKAATPEQTAGLIKTPEGKGQGRGQGRGASRGKGGRGRGEGGRGLAAAAVKAGERRATPRWQPSSQSLNPSSVV
jgi:hypothetical protein